MKKKPDLRSTTRAPRRAANAALSSYAAFQPVGAAAATELLVPAAGPTKVQSVVTAERVRVNVQSRVDPLPYLTPELLVRMHQDFRRGYLIRAALAWEDIKHTDDRLVCVAPKREKSVARHGYEITVSTGHEKDAKALKHKAALEYFYANLVCEDAFDRNNKGGTKLLLKTMMRAVGYKWAVHEIMWKPNPPEGLTAQLNFCPLWFFENTTGRLRFLQTDWQLYGTDLVPGEWLITSGDGLMKSCAILYLIKHLPLRDWLIYCERQAIPGIHGETSAGKGTPEWDELIDALKNFATDFSILTSPGTKINAVDIAAKGELAYPKLVDWADRAFASIWRGGDLSSGSHQGGGQGQGASLQADEGQILEQGDAELLSDTLNEQLDRYVILYQFGDETPLAGIRVKTGVTRDVEQDIETDSFLLQAGVPMAVSELAQRYGRTLPEGSAELAHAPAAAAAATKNGEGLMEDAGEKGAAANAASAINHAPSSMDRLVSQAVADTLQIRAEWVKPFFAALEAKAGDKSLTAAELLDAIEEMAGHLPELMQDRQPAQIAKLVEGLLGAGVVHGVAASLAHTEAAS